MGVGRRAPSSLGALFIRGAHTVDVTSAIEGYLALRSSLSTAKSTMGPLLDLAVLGCRPSGGRPFTGERHVALADYALLFKHCTANDMRLLAEKYWNHPEVAEVDVVHGVILTEDGEPKGIVTRQKRCRWQSDEACAERLGYSSAKSFNVSLCRARKRVRKGLEEVADRCDRRGAATPHSASRAV
jgi:hypothetical protein